MEGICDWASLTGDASPEQTSILAEPDVLFTRLS